MTLPHGAMGWSAFCDWVFPDHTHFLFYFIFEIVIFRWFEEMFFAPLPMVFIFCSSFRRQECVLMLVTSTLKKQFSPISY